MEQILVDEQGNQIEPSGFLLPSAYQIKNKIIYLIVNDMTWIVQNNYKFVA